MLETAVQGKVTGGATLPFPSVGNQGGTGRGSVWELAGGPAGSAVPVLGSGRSRQGRAKRGGHRAGPSWLGVGWRQGKLASPWCEEPSGKRVEEELVAELGGRKGQAWAW